MTTQPVIEVEDLVVELTTDQGVVRAVDGVSFSLQHGDTLGIVGESGCGKTMTCLALLGLVPSPVGRIVRGAIRVKGRDIVGLGERRLRAIRGQDVAMIFQEPMTALNPVFSVRSHLVDVLQRQGLRGRTANARALTLLDQVGIAAAAKRLDDYPHQLSGGMRQRVMIAMALACKPSVLVADEPTTALDVTTQAQVLDLIDSLREAHNMSVVLVSHDFGVIAKVCRNVMVMYRGETLEVGRTAQVLAKPQHIYTRALLNAVPRIRADRADRLPVVSDTVPVDTLLPSGRPFFNNDDLDSGVDDAAVIGGASQ
ncbi:MAG: ABC transporter ATP-binding protein [Pseudomonadota bacterium]